eukprot:3578300-Prymnesium_polylepis.1
MDGVLQYPYVFLNTLLGTVGTRSAAGLGARSRDGAGLRGASRDRHAPPARCAQAPRPPQRGDSMSQANWGFKQVFGDRDSTEEPADGARHVGPRDACVRAGGSGHTAPRRLLPRRQPTLSHLPGCASR